MAAVAVFFDFELRVACKPGADAAGRMCLAWGRRGENRGPASPIGHESEAIAWARRRLRRPRPPGLSMGERGPHRPRPARPGNKPVRGYRVSDQRADESRGQIGTDHFMHACPAAPIAARKVRPPR